MCRAAKRVVLLSPQGKQFTQSLAAEFARCEQLVLICGRYEGVDERVAEALVTDEVSIGDYVLSGGEPAALVVVDAVVRLIPGALGSETSATTESFSDGLLDYPHYTRPPEFEGLRRAGSFVDRQSCGDRALAAAKLRKRRRRGIGRIF